MINPCASIVNCPLPASYPLSSYNAETPDVLTFIGQGFGPLTPPPLNWNFSEATAYAHYDSTISQADADQNALNNAVYLAQQTWYGPGQQEPYFPQEPGFNPFPPDVFLGEVGGVNTPPLL